MNERKRTALPDFIVLGVSKTGTNWLYECLQAHPAVCLAKDTKNTYFFDEFYAQGIEWYKRFFADCPEQCVTGEVSETYLYSKDVPERIHRHIPNVKLIACLRNPVERTLSEYLQLRKFGLGPDTLEQALVDLKRVLINNNFYYDELVNYLAYFPREQLLILLYDDLKQDAGLFLRRIYEFIGVDAEFVPGAVRREVNVAQKARWRFLNVAAIHVVFLLRRLNMRRLIAVFKKSPAVRRILFRKLDDGEYPQLSEATRRYLQDVYRDQIGKLSVLLGRDLRRWL